MVGQYYKGQDTVPLLLELGTVRVASTIFNQPNSSDSVSPGSRILENGVGVLVGRDGAMKGDGVCREGKTMAMFAFATHGSGVTRCWG